MSGPVERGPGDDAYVATGALKPVLGSSEARATALGGKGTPLISPSPPPPPPASQDYYRVILEDESLIKRFHADVNNDPNATVSPWEGDHRTVAFHMTLNVPGMIKKMIGEDVIIRGLVCGDQGTGVW